ncbi:hypothetical protein SAMN06296008_101352 [Polynucleobacter kasalickyi]|uniref:Uncharacterized protein n=1 Tax=Polynucleobacter kasalickyi TaxID=1938817 RepID=A0A1W1Y5F3_9BURK|nr:hypothetical protein SAMN06296008_101352 [Polynucleobacter kasalickyi]
MNKFLPYLLLRKCDETKVDVNQIGEIYFQNPSLM